MRKIVRLFNALVFKNKPVYVHYGITHRCNLRCKMCNINQDVDKEDELSFQEIGQLFDVIKKLGVLYVSIGGGEPLLRDDLPGIIRLLKKKGFMVRLLTNGLLAKEAMVKELAASGLREVSISLDTLDAKKQGQICEYDGVWDQINQALRLFSKFVPRGGRRLLINTVVSPLNIGELPALSQFAKKSGWYISFLPVESNKCSSFMFTPHHHEDIDKSYDILLNQKRKGEGNIFNSSWFLERSRHYLKTGITNWRCNAGKLYFSVNPKGEFSICHRFNPEMSILKDGFRDFLSSGEFKKKTIDLINGCPGCLRPCWAEISSVFSNTKSFLEAGKMFFNE